MSGVACSNFRANFEKKWDKTNLVVEANASEHVRENVQPILVN